MNSRSCVSCIQKRSEGSYTLEFDEEGNLQFQVEALEADAMFDDIGSVLRIKELRKTKKELLESLELYYRVFFLGEGLGNRICCWLLMWEIPILPWEFLKKRIKGGLSV